MNYRQPNQRVSDKRWDYTNTNDKVTYPIGYCREFKELDSTFFLIREEEKVKHRQFKDKYHTDGHATAEEACQCYKTYILDHDVREYESSNSQHKCAVCQNWTSHVVEVGTGIGQIFNLCPEHSTREHLEKLYEVGESISSC